MTVAPVRGRHNIPLFHPKVREEDKNKRRKKKKNTKQQNSCFCYKVNFYRANPLFTYTHSIKLELRLGLLFFFFSPPLDFNTESLLFHSRLGVPQRSHVNFPTPRIHYALKNWYMTYRNYRTHLAKFECAPSAEANGKKRRGPPHGRL